MNANIQMEARSKLDLWSSWNRGYIDFKESTKESGDQIIADYLGIDVNTYKRMLISFGAWSKPHGAPSTFFFTFRDAEKALEWARSVEMANMMAG